MQPALIPQPRKLTLRPGNFVLPRTAAIGIDGHDLYPVAEEARALFRRASINAAAPGCADTLALRADTSLDGERYRLTIGPGGMSIEGRDAVAVRHGLRTLEQIRSQARSGRLPCLKVDDWPDFRDRGVYYDICRGRVPALERLFELAGTLARYKINQLQLYIEHTFAFRAHPDIGRGASPLTAEDILRLDAFCREAGVELVPSLACFGHMSNILVHKRYRHLAEDLGVGKYVLPKSELPGFFKHKGWTLTPANPEGYVFLDELFREFLPLFSSKRFNICCDETWDLGHGASYELCRKRGKGRVYLEHIARVCELSRKYGKQAMFWGDIIRHYPELIPDVPGDAIVLDWGYDATHPFERVSDFAASGKPYYVCPGTSAWQSLFPRIHESGANIRGFAAAGKRHGAQGLLNTDWGDGGHYNFMEFSWYGYLYGAEQAWNTRADAATFSERFARLFLRNDSRDLVRALDRLGDIAHLKCGTYYQSIWPRLFFARPGDPIFRHAGPLDASVSRNGRISARKIKLNAEMGRRTRAEIEKVKAVFAEQLRAGDPSGVLRYWMFAIDTLTHAAGMLAAFGGGGEDTPAVRAALKREKTGLMRRFESLWMERNRRGGIRIALRRYRRAIAGLS